MTEVLMGLAVLFAIVAYAMVRGAAEEKRKRDNYRLELKNSFGKFGNVRHSKDELGRIARLYEKSRTDEYCVDDITWNDLDMDNIFEMMDFAQSSSGEEYLYAMLRQPKLSLDESGFGELDSHVDYMAKNEDMRLDVMMALNDLGKSGRYSIYDYLDLLGETGKRRNGRHYFCIAILIFAFATIYVNALLGVALIFCAGIYNITSYLSDKGKSAPYVSTFSYIIRLMRCRDKILALGLGSQMGAFTSALDENRGRFKGFDRNSNLVLGMNSSVGSFFGVFFEYIKMLTHIDLIKFNNMLRLVQENDREILSLAEDIGYIDAVISIAYFRAALPFCTVPELRGGKSNMFVIHDGYHPALSNAVANSFEQSRGMLITGSNASGKSTFLKMTAVNAILAQTIHLCAASMYCGGLYRIYSSMALRDNLGGGESYYIVEIKALKRILDEAKKDSPNPVLCFVDEVLRGTNTVERIAASTQILEALSQDGIICFAATHDIELTTLLEDKYDNFHFEEEVGDGDIKFPYHMKSGKSKTRNAIKLLDIMGFSDDIVEKANVMAKEFTVSGNWTSV